MTGYGWLRKTDTKCEHTRIVKLDHQCGAVGSLRLTFGQHVQENKQGKQKEQRDQTLHDVNSL
jgi:hypothetical protein